jgi:hypothetical protein
VPVVVMGWTGDREGGVREDCLGRVGAFSFSMARDVAADDDEVCKGRPDWLDGRWQCEP